MRAICNPGDPLMIAAGAPLNLVRHHSIPAAFEPTIDTGVVFDATNVAGTLRCSQRVATNVVVTVRRAPITARTNPRPPARSSRLRGSVSRSAARLASQIRRVVLVHVHFQMRILRVLESSTLAGIVPDDRVPEAGRAHPAFAFDHDAPVRVLGA